MKILTASQIKSAENAAVTSGAATYASLMEKAGKSAARVIIDRYDVKNKTVNVVCGGGNNGGDGIVIADVLMRAGAIVTVTAPFGLPATETALHFTPLAEKIPVTQKVEKNADFIIDALFGTGLNRPPADSARDVITDMNKAQGIKIAVDIPSGVYADGGCADTAFSADLTVTFIGLKLCQLLPDTSSLCGKVVLCSLDLDPRDYSYTTIEKPPVVKRDKNAHKGTFGTAFMICGSYGMCGASVLAASAALHSGAGIVKCIVCDKNYSAFCTALPEAVTVPVPTDESGAPVVFEKTLFSGLSSSNACLIGCGLGRSDEAQRLVKKTLEISEIPTVIDADGINGLLKDINILCRTKAPVIITPHPAEMARLCETTVADIEHNRIRYAKTFAAAYNCIVVLKGANTIVAAPDGKLFFNVTGNPGMATAGSGDVLSGIMAAYLAAGLPPLIAALAAVYDHGAAGDRARNKHGERYMCAGDIIKGLSSAE